MSGRGTSAPLTALVVTHGRVGEALLDAARGIAGRADGVTALSNEGLAPAEVQRRIERWIAEEADPRLAVILVDLAGGSCCLVSRQAARAHARVAVISGVNLPMLIEFLQYRDHLEPTALLERLESRAKRAVAVLESPEAAERP